MEHGERLLIPCDGGPSRSRLVRYPPPLEVEEDTGVYVLVDDGPDGGLAVRVRPPDAWLDAGGEVGFGPAELVDGEAEGEAVGHAADVLDGGGGGLG